MSIDQLSASIAQPLASLWNGFVGFVPGLIGAIAVLIIGYLVGLLVYVVLSAIFNKIKLDKLVLDHAGLSKSVGKFKVGETLAVISKWYVIILFLNPAAALLNAGTLSVFLTSLSLWIPNVIAAILISLIGIIVAEYVQGAIVHTKAKGAEVVGQVTKAIIIVFVLVTALEQVGFNLSFAQDTILILVAGISLAIALSLGLSFGLGGQAEAKKTIATVKKKL